MAGQTINVSILADTKQFSNAMGDISSPNGGLGRLGGLAKKAGVAVAAGLATAGAAAAGLAVKSIGLASDLQQSMGGVDAVFKETASQVHDFAAKASMAAGLSKNSYNELATVIGTTLKNAGTPMSELAGVTDTLISRAADMAATFGGPVTDASNAMASALRGEFEPLRKYGVSLSQAEINSRALADTGKKTADSLTKQEKALAAQALIMEQSTDAAGAFARESNTLAGQTERLKAEMENLGASVGTALLPILTDLATWATTTGLPALKEFGHWVKDELWPALKQGYETIAPGLKQALDVLGGGVGENSIKWKELGTFITGTVIPFLSELFKVILPAVAANIRMNADALAFAWSAFQKFTEIATAAIAGVISTIAGLLKTWGNMLVALGKVPGFDWATEAGESLLGASQKADGLANSIRNIPQAWRVRIDVDQFIHPVQGRIADGSGGFINPGMRAAGGPVLAGQPYIVGEKRPELFIPNVNGTIVPSVPTAYEPIATVEKDSGSKTADIAKALAEVLDGASLRLTGIDKVTGYASARLVAAIGRV